VRESELTGEFVRRNPNGMIGRHGAFDDCDIGTE